MTVKARSKKVNEFIDKGGEVKKEGRRKREDWKQIALYLPPQYLKLIHESMKRNIFMSRNSWILHAIQSYLDKGL